MSPAYAPGSPDKDSSNPGAVTYTPDGPRYKAERLVHVTHVQFVPGLPIVLCHVRPLSYCSAYRKYDVDRLRRLRVLGERRRLLHDRDERPCV